MGAPRLKSDPKSNRLPSLALDHLTVVDATASQLVECAAAAGCNSVCFFLEPMAVLPLMPQFALYGQTQDANETKARMQALGVGLDLAYPFTLASRTELEAFRPALETAAWFGAVSVNALLYDRDASRRLDNFGAFVGLAAEYGLKVAVEFFPLSQIPSLAAALALVTAIGKPAQAGINVDLLHLMRSGGSLEELRAMPAEYIHYAQYCDGSLPGPAAGMTAADEASSFRLLPGEGAFDLAGFAACLPGGTPASVELPRNGALRAGDTMQKRADIAMNSVRRALAAG
jgi:sugar phosphate isomerase/epimerase